MIFDDFVKIATYLKAAYPNNRILPDDPTVRFWFKMLEDLDFKVCENAVLELISSAAFPPSIADIRKKCASRKAEIPEWGEAWERVQKAIRYYGAYRDDEAMESLDAITREAVRRMGYKSLCYSDIKNAETDRAQFREIYNQTARPHLEASQMPAAVLEEKGRLMDRYIGKEKEEPPKLISTAEIIEEALSRRASPEYVRRLIESSGLFSDENKNAGEA